MNDLQENTINLPFIPLRGRVLFPNNTTQIEVGRPNSKKALEKATSTDKKIFLATQMDARVDEPQFEDMYYVGVICKIREVTNISNNGKRVLLDVLNIARFENVEEVDGVKIATVTQIEYVGEQDVDTSVLRTLIGREIGKIKVLQKNKDTRLDVLIGLEESNHVYVNLIANTLPLPENKKQKILETLELNERMHSLLVALKELNEFIEAEKKIAERVKTNMDKAQKEYYLREQLKAIHAELGDDENEIEKLREQILAKKMPKEVEEKALKELNRMSRMNSSSPDYTVLRGYIDWVIDLPFSPYGDDISDLNTAKEILEKEHYGLEKIKDRILEYLAVFKLTGKLRGPILCLYGPPGVGKTSIAGSIARALNRKFVRMSLGGVKDEAEVRGHRKTYIGAMPGRIIFGLKEAGCNNPVFLLDEIDKLSSDLRGDPASALLEVLDPEQNSTFRDRYMEIPYDLSNVMFVTTANSLDTIPQPLLDRMEVLTISGYTYQEKEEIAKRFLIPRQMEANGINKSLIKFTDGGIRLLIEGYTKEAGVRNLERVIGTVCRKVATDYSLTGKKSARVISEKTLNKYLGAIKFEQDEKLENSEIGVATGLAWTSVGGTTLPVEVTLMEGKGNLILTGKLGEVMQESAKTALSFIKANLEKYNVEKEIFENKDIHIHVPEGATPKDGPSAGITLATAILSALTGKRVRNDVAMTGEITLRGRVLAIGGLKEKALAAYKIGIKTVIIPFANKKDLEEIPEVIREQMEFIPVKEFSQVANVMFCGE